MYVQDNYKWKVCVSCMTFNHASYIVDALNGFCIQKTNFPYVCTIVDDSSTDGEQEVINSYLEEHFELTDFVVGRNEETEDFKLIFAQHKFNKYCFFAVLFLKYNHYQNRKSKLPYLKEWRETAKYIAICEGDDYWIDTNKLQKQVSFLESHPDYTMCYAKCRYYYQSKQKFNNKSWGGSYVEFKDLLRGNTVPTLTVVLRNSIIHEYRSFTSSIQSSANWLMGDYPLWLFCAIKGKIHFMNWDVGVYRVLENSASHSQAIEKKMDFSMNMVDIMEFFNKEFNGGYSSKHFDSLRGFLRLRTYAIYGCFNSFIKEWCTLIKTHPMLLFDRRAYLYFSFFIVDGLSSSRK